LGKPSAPAGVLSVNQARCLQLAAQGLLQPPRRRAKRTDVPVIVERMRLLQIDTIHVVARSPYLVLHARLGDYPPEWLDEALERGRLAECWAHEACFVPASDVALHRAWRGQRDGHWAHRHARRMRDEHAADMDALLAHIRANGPVRAADFERSDRGASGWWEWKLEKRWLEAWFASGELMVARRDRFQRVYDVAERVLARLNPSLDAADAGLSHEDLRRRFILDSVRALGVARARWIADYYRLKPGVTARELQPLRAGRNPATCMPIMPRCWRRRAPDDCARRIPPCCRRSIHWSGIAPACMRCSISTTASNATCRPRNAGTAITCCRSCIAADWPGGWMPRRIVPRVCSR
jgi:hypothetical protein